MRWPIAAIAVVVACRFEPGIPGAGDDAAPGDLDASPSDARTDSDVPATDASVADAPPARPCPAGYTALNAAEPGATYRNVTASATWAAAEADCRDDGGGAFADTHLIVLDDAAERAWAYQHCTTDKWLGMTDINVEGTFLAITAQPSPYVGSAGSNQQSKDCMFTNQNETVMETCSSGFPYICECDGHAADPSRFGQ